MRSIEGSIREVLKRNRAVPFAKLILMLGFLNKKK